MNFREKKEIEKFRKYIHEKVVNLAKEDRKKQRKPVMYDWVNFIEREMIGKQFYNSKLIRTLAKECYLIYLDNFFIL